MKKFISIFVLLMTVLSISPIMTSCSKDDDDNSIIGTWRCDWEDEYAIFTFNKNMTYTYLENDAYLGHGYSEFGTYTVRAGKYIDMIYTDSYGDRENNTLVIVSKTSDTMVCYWVYEEEDIFVLKKTK